MDILKQLYGDGNEGKLVERKTFRDFAKKQKTVLFLAFSMQKKLADCIIGNSFWKTQCKKRDKMLTKDLEDIKLIRSNILNGTLNIDKDGVLEQPINGNEKTKPSRQNSRLTKQISMKSNATIVPSLNKGQSFKSNKDLLDDKKVPTNDNKNIVNTNNNRGFKKNSASSEEISQLQPTYLSEVKGVQKSKLMLNSKSIKNMLVENNNSVDNASDDDKPKKEISSQLAELSKIIDTAVIKNPAQKNALLNVSITTSVCADTTNNPTPPPATRGLFDKLGFHGTLTNTKSVRERASSDPTVPSSSLSIIQGGILLNGCNALKGVDNVTPKKRTTKCVSEKHVRFIVEVEPDPDDDDDDDD